MIYNTLANAHLYQGISDWLQTGLEALTHSNFTRKLSHILNIIVLKYFGRQAILRLKSVHGHIASAAKCCQLHIFNTPRSNESNIVSRYRADPGDA